MRPVRKPRLRPTLLPALVYTALTTAVVSSLGMLLVPTLSQEMSVSVSAAQWMLTVNLLVGAVATPIMGRLSDGPHKKRLLLGSLAIILAGSVLAACAPNFAVFLVGRALQGLSYGIVPMTIALARRYLPEEQIRPGLSSLSVTASTGLGIGYPLTGILAGEAGFRVAFAFAAVFLVSAVIVAWRVIPDGPDEQAPRTRFDAPGAALLGLGLTALLIAISEGPNWEWTSAKTLGFALAAVVLLGAWVLVELRTDTPLIDLRVFRHRDVVLANGTAIGLGAAMYIGLSVSSLIAQAPATTGYGIALPVFWAGFVMLPLSIGSLGANRAVRAVSHRIQLTTLLPLGAGGMTASAILLWLVHDQLWEILVGMLLFGLGIGTTYAAMPALIARRVADTELGSAVSFNQVLRTVGGAFGSAASGAVLAAHLGSDLHPSDTGITLALALGVCGCAIVFAALSANYVHSRRAHTAPELSRIP
ncbi:MFS transporter [Nocardia carnea]|uniref:MFS transporter n=1 Tax=Nocardia carnea TaxID=37328 RepID=UPI002455DE69|nr:MFS transporter [Nocardia carnea]